MTSPAVGQAHGTSPSNTDHDPFYRKEHGFYYLTPEAVRAIPHYQYHGEDRSLFFKYILSPLAELLVQTVTPRTLAPNTITLAGLCLMITAYCAVWYYVPTLQVLSDETNEETAPRWVFLLNCVAMLVYQTLDNMDGKQARRTKSSSPLGLLFDHGCDAINSIFGSANWIVAMGLNPNQDSLLCWILVIGPYALFYIATWEEYYTGELIMPLMNGPSEGVFGGAMLSLTTYFYGPRFWLSYSLFDEWLGPLLASKPFLISMLRMRNADFVVLASCIGFVQEILLKSTTVIRKYGRKALHDILPFAIVVVCTWLIGWYDKHIWLNEPRTTLHLYACLIVEMVTELMRAHICEEQFQPFRRWCVLPLILLTCYIVVADAVGAAVSPSWMDDFLVIYASAGWMYLMLKLCIIIDEICQVLNIWCFDIVTPRGRLASLPPLATDGSSTVNGHHKTS